MAEKLAKPVTGPVFDEVFQNIRKAAEASLSLQQEWLSQWSAMWPGVAAPQSSIVKQFTQIRSKVVENISSLARKQRETVDRQYNAALESLEAALCVTEAGTPEEFRRRSEQLCRKSLECIREVAEAQIETFQDAASKLTELVGKATP